MRVRKERIGMKKVILAVLIVCFLVVAGFFVYQEFFAQKELTPEDLVPFGALAYSHVYDVEARWAAFEKSKLIQEISQISLNEFLDKMGAQSHEKMTVNMVLEQLKSPANRQLVNQFLGQEVAVAIYPTEKKEFGPEMWMDAATNIMIVTRLKPEVRFVELITPVFSKFNQEISESETPYKKYTIHLLSVFGDQVTIGYVRFGDLLVVGLGDRAARRAIDVVSGDLQSLAKDPQFSQSIPAETGRGDVTFFNYATFAQKMKEYILSAAMKDGSNWTAQVQVEIEENFKQMNGFKTMVSVMQYGEVNELSSVVHFEPENMHPDVLPFYQVRPQENTSLDFIPADVVYYQWQGGIDFKQYWIQAKKQMQMIAERSGQAPGAGPDQFVQAMETQAGMSIEKGILPLFGDEMGGFLLDIGSMGPFPLPKLAVFLEVTNEAKITELLNKMLDTLTFIRIESEEYQGVYLRYASIPMAEGISPSCGVFNKFLVCTTNRELFKSMVDISKNIGDKSISLKGNRLFNNPQYRLTRPSNGVFFVNVPNLMDKLSVLVDVFEQWMAMQEAQQKALRSGTEKRLEDINSKLAQSRDVFSALEQELVGLQEQKTATPAVDTSRLESVAQELDRQQKIRENFQNRLEELQKEEEELLAVQAVEGQKLSTAGQLRLKEVQTDIASQKERISGLEGKLTELTRQHQELMAAANSSDGVQKLISDKETKLAQVREEIKDDEEIREEIKVLLEGYNNRDSVSEEERMYLVKSFLKPLLSAFKNIHWIAGRMEIHERTIRSDMMFKYE